MNCDRGKHDFGAHMRSGGGHRGKERTGVREAFCLQCGEPNPRCAECGRAVVATETGTRCVKGHSFARPGLSKLPETSMEAR